jgi:hypothetical protein
LALAAFAVAVFDLSESGEAVVGLEFVPTEFGGKMQPLRVIPASKSPMIKGNLLMSECRMTNFE